MFVVHENFNSSHDYTRIHHDYCRHFMNRDGDSTQNTNWYYPFSSYDIAYTYAENLHRKKGPFPCKDCRPEL